MAAGWLRATFPSTPSAWEIHLTEGGLQGTPQYETQQAQALCDAFRNMLGTPGVESYAYTPMSEHQALMPFGLYHGLRRNDPGQTLKPRTSPRRRRTVKGPTGRTCSDTSIGPSP